MSTPSDIVLIGAGRSPHTKQLRARNGFPKRNLWIGTIQILTGMRVPVDAAFLKAHFDAIVGGVESGTLLVEYKFDKFVDPEELKALAYGSDEEKAAYEAEAGKQLEERAGTLAATAEEKRAADEETARLTRWGDEQARQAAAQAEPPNALQSPAPPAPPVVEEHEHEEAVSEPPPPVAPSEARTSDPNFKPLPDSWRSAPKTDLLTYCEERGIDTSDMPSNRVLRQRLHDYLVGV